MIRPQVFRRVLVAGSLSVSCALAQPAAPELMLPSLPISAAPPAQPASPASRGAESPPLTSSPTVPPAKVAAPAESSHLTQSLSAILKPNALNDAALPVEPEKIYSYGKFSNSLLFTPEQVTQLKQKIESVENKPAALPEPVKAEVVKPAEPEKPAAVVVDPASYPVFYLSSIVYRSPMDWTIWVSGKKITPKKNDTDVKIMAVSASQATLSWTPSFKQSFAQRRALKAFAPTDRVKNLLAPGDLWRFDDATSTAIFTLRPNQSFSAGYMAVFEGHIESPKLPELAEVTKSGPANVAAALNAIATNPESNASGGVVHDAINRIALKANVLPPDVDLNEEP